jgi:hypothetical protein
MINSSKLYRLEIRADGELTLCPQLAQAGAGAHKPWTIKTIKAPVPNLTSRLK